jgi:hypothetical protein
MGIQCDLYLADRFLCPDDGQICVGTIHLTSVFQAFYH